MNYNSRFADHKNITHTHCEPSKA